MQIQSLTYNTTVGHCPNNTGPVFAGKLDGAVWSGMQWHLIMKSEQDFVIYAKLTVPTTSLLQSSIYPKKIFRLLHGTTL